MQNNLWNDVLKKLEKRINRPSFNTWLRPTFLASADEQKICIGVPDEVFVYWLGEYYVHVIADILVELLGAQVQVLSRLLILAEKFLFFQSGQS